MFKRKVVTFYFAAVVAIVVVVVIAVVVIVIVVVVLMPDDDNIACHKYDYNSLEKDYNAEEFFSVLVPWRFIHNRYCLPSTYIIKVGVLDSEYTI